MADPGPAATSGCHRGPEVDGIVNHHVRFPFADHPGEVGHLGRPGHAGEHESPHARRRLRRVAVQWLRFSTPGHSLLHFGGAEPGAEGPKAGRLHHSPAEPLGSGEGHLVAAPSMALARGTNGWKWPKPGMQLNRARNS